MDESSVTSQMQEAVDLIVSEVGGIRTGRATTSLVDEIVVPAYGGTQKLKVNELANINTTDSQTIVIDPWDKSVIGEIKKGIEAANVGLNPSIDGDIIRISVPPMTGEDRQKFIKLLSKKIENGKIMIRQARGEAMKEIKNAFEDKQITEDQKFAQEKRLQEITDKFVDKLDEIEETKKQELLQV